MDNSLDMMDYQEQALREIWRVMKPGASLALDCKWFDEVIMIIVYETSLRTIQSFALS